MNHEAIWLSPVCEVGDPEERMWCNHDPGPCDECDAPSVKYIRADLVPLIRAAALEEAAKELAWLAREERNLDGATLSRAAEYLDTLRALIPPTPPPFAASA